MRRSIRLLVGFGLLVLLVVALDPSSLLLQVGSLDAGLAALAITGLVAIHLVQAFGWRSILAANQVVVAPSWSIRTYYAAQAAGAVTPANLAGDAHRVMALRGLDVGWGPAVTSIVVQRATSYLALAAIGAVGVTSLTIGGHEFGGLLLIAGPVVAACAAVGWLLITRPSWPGARWLMRPVTAGKGGNQGHFVKEGTSPRMTAAGAGTGFLLGAMFHAGAIGLTWLLVVALDPRAGFDALAAVAVARLALAIPLTPSGLGVQEGALAALLAGLMLGAGTGLAAVMLSRIATLATAVIGVLLLVGEPQRSPAEAPGRPRPSSTGQDAEARPS
jgi:uncharacterized membrane protein YbhN (UPF0104 family)